MRLISICLLSVLTGCVTFGSEKWFEPRRPSLAAQAAFELDCKADEVQFEPAGEGWTSVIGKCGNKSALYKKRYAVSGGQLAEGDWERQSEIKVAN